MGGSWGGWNSLMFISFHGISLNCQVSRELVKINKKLEWIGGFRRSKVETSA